MINTVKKNPAVRFLRYANKHGLRASLIKSLEKFGFLERDGRGERKPAGKPVGKPAGKEPHSKLGGLMRKLIRYDVISFDVFDTLIFRPFTNPADLFTLLSSELNYSNFKELRMKAEKEIRDIKLSKEGNREVTIIDIYEKLWETTGLDPARCAKFELETELRFCYANPYMKAAYDALIQEGKRVILVSNMYYPADMLTEILTSCGYVGHEKLFVSCDYGLNKYDGKLFQYINSTYFFGEDIEKSLKIIHIGDNKETDVAGSELAGWDNYYYRVCCRPITNFGEGGLVGSSWNAVVQNFLNNSYSCNEYPNRDTTMWKYGFKYGGFMVLGYVNYIYKYCIDQQVDKVLFLSRDGYFLKEIFEQLYSDIPADYVYWSRSAMLTNMPEHYLDECFNHYFLRRYYSSGKRVALDEALVWLSLESLSELWVATSDGEQLITDKNIQIFRQFFIDNRNTFFERCSKDDGILREYFLSIVSNSKHVAIVDIGWRGTGAISLRKLLKEVWGLDCRVSGILFGNVSGGKDFDAAIAYQGLLSSYAFSETTNKEHADYFRKNRSKMSAVAEIILAAAPVPSFRGFGDEKDGGYFYFSIPEIENYSKIRDIHRGENDFINEYIQRTKGDPALNKISSGDAFAMLKRLMNDKLLLKEIGSFVYPQFLEKEVSGTGKIEKLSDFCSLENHLDCKGA
ncbi:MAG: hypothetical protein FWG23_01525 [Eggerthellaceae bacterium]|nr:hypothetical protein [Eggerthellaceae bacterium]